MLTKENVLTSVKQCLDMQGLHYDVSDEIDVITFGLADENGQVSCRIGVLAQEIGFVCYTALTRHAEENMRPQVAEFITRANYGLFIGNFEMDWGDGEVRYKMFIPYYDAVPPTEHILMGLHMGVSMLQRYIDGLNAVMDGKAFPRDALAKAEKLS